MVKTEKQFCLYLPVSSEQNRIRICVGSAGLDLDNLALVVRDIVVFIT